MDDDYIAKAISVNGIVQGVGFRPFVYQLAEQHRIRGEVANTSDGVSIHIEGHHKDIESFCTDLLIKNPPLSHIADISVSVETVRNHKAFSIMESRCHASRSTLISPDVSVCDDCLREMFDPNDRRYGYPFINCTNCGPRYTIISDIPYDRPNTSMQHFKMCEKCQAEYDDPKNRRFHAQPNACEKCGPHVTLCDKDGNKVAAENPIQQAAALLKKGHILAIKGLGGFHLATDAENNEAVSRLRLRKHREEKPFALMSYDIRLIKKYAHVKPDESPLLLSLQRPIVILEKKEPNPISDEVSTRNRYFGAMLPYTPLHYLLLKNNFTALVMTSGNLSDEPIAIENEDALKRLSGIADFFLLHNRDIYLRSDDSIVKNTNQGTCFIRRSRGYIPKPIFMKHKVPQILACGAELKNTICLTKRNMAFLSQHIGDMENLPTYEFFKLTVAHMQEILDIRPEMIAHDLHPDYLSTQYAQEQEGMKKIPIQHHHAHIASCMAENSLEGPAIGLAFDGTGYGTDESIWGGEVLMVEGAKFERMAHLSAVAMPGGGRAIKEPWRMAVSYLYNAFGEALWDLDLPVLKKDKKKISTVTEMIKKQVNSPYTSSMGRFFDGIAGILGIRSQVCFEGQAAIELEMMAAQNANTNAVYEYAWTSESERRIFLQPIVRGIVKDMAKGVSLSEISGKFHMTLIQLFTELCQVLKKESGLNRIALSGGVFQNMMLLKGLTRTLENTGFQVVRHAQVPANDGGISLGQAMIAAESIRH